MRPRRHAGGRRRLVQVLLGLIWLLDGGLQLQSFMYSHGFLAMLEAGAAGQPSPLRASILWGAHLAAGDLGVWNTLFALTQLAIGAGLLYRPAVRTALVASAGWALIVWWFGEGLGGVLNGTAQPLTGAPGAALLYVLISLIAWPSARPGGLLGPRGSRATWSVLWLAMAGLGLTSANRGPGATASVLASLGSGIGPLDGLAHSLGRAVAGEGLPIAITLALVSAGVGLAVAVGFQPRRFLLAGAILSLGYWLLGQGLGGIFAGGATDPNAGPLFCLLAFALLDVGPARRGPRVRAALSLRSTAAT